MIEIKSVGGRVLYTAKTAIDIRQAVEEAVKERANLAGAYLADAYLADANLAGAYLAGADLAGANLAGAYLARADLAGAYLAGANLARANLAGADLADADLAGAYLAGANLARANLAGADLAGADLADADLAGAKGVNAWRIDPLRILLDQPGPIRAYKLVDHMYGSPITQKPRLEYTVGTRLEVKDASTDEGEHCGAGINVATWPWIAANYQPGYRVMVVEFEQRDIAAIPVGTDGKFRVHRCVVVDEITDLASRGIGQLTNEKEAR